MVPFLQEVVDKFTVLLLLASSNGHCWDIFILLFAKLDPLRRQRKSKSINISES